MKALTATSGPGLTFGQLVFLIGVCGIIFNVTINVKVPAKEIHQGSSFKQTARQRNTKESFQLSVPFYVYEHRDLNWQDATLNGEPYEPASPSAGGCGTFVFDQILLC